MINKKVLTIVLVIALIFLGIVIVSASGMLEKKEGTTKATTQPSFSIDEFYATKNKAMIVYGAQGIDRILFMTLSGKPVNEIYILDQKGIGNENFAEFVRKIEELSGYNFTIKVVGPEADVKNGIYIIPTGAMPEHIIAKIKKEDIRFIYIGQTDLVIKSTVKKEDWYSELTQQQKNKIIIENTTVNEILSQGKVDELNKEILENSWQIRSYLFIDSKKAKGTVVLPVTNGTYVRVIATGSGKKFLKDIEIKNKIDEITTTTNIYPWEQASADIIIKKSNGTAQFVVEKDGKTIKTEKLERVSEESFFRKTFQPSESGEYLVKVVDNSGTIEIGTTHVKNVNIELKEVKGNFYMFYVSVDGIALKEGEANVSIKNSTTPAQHYMINDGMLTVGAKLQKGKSILVFNLLGGKIDVNIEPNEQTNIYEVYTKYGPIGILIILIIYAIAVLNRKQAYKIRVVELAPEIRKEVKITYKLAQEIFRSVRQDLKVDGPIKTQEFAVGLKRYATEGADVTEGNVEEILKKMSGNGIILSWKGYHQLATEGKIRTNVMKRIIREKLIERGIEFKINGEKYQTRDFEIGFFGDRFKKKAIVVFEDYEELKRTLASLSEKERSKLFLKEFNGILNLVSIDQLEDVL